MRTTLKAGAVLLLLLLTGCFGLGSFSSSKTAEGDERTNFDIVRLGTDTVSAVEAGSRMTTRAIQAAQSNQDKARADLEAERARGRKLEARTAEVEGYDAIAQKLLNAMAVQDDPPSDLFPIAGTDKAAIQDISRRRLDGELTDNQARDLMLPYITKYGL